MTPAITVGSIVTPSFPRNAGCIAAPAAASFATSSFHTAALLGLASHAGTRYGAATIAWNFGLVVVGNGMTRAGTTRGSMAVCREHGEVLFGQ